MAWHCISPELIVKGFKKCCISKAEDETDDDRLWMAMKRMGMLGVSVRKMRALTMKVETDTNL